MGPHRTSEEIDKFVGAKIRARRMMLGISQTKLATELDITFQQIQKYEKGTNRVSASSLWHIGRCLKVPPAFFFEGLGPNGAAAKVGNGQDDLLSLFDFIGRAEGAQLLTALRGIPKPVAQALAKLSQAIANEI